MIVTRVDHESLHKIELMIIIFYRAMLNNKFGKFMKSLQKFKQSYQLTIPETCCDPLSFHEKLMSLCVGLWLPLPERKSMSFVPTASSLSAWNRFLNWPLKIFILEQKFQNCMGIGQLNLEDWTKWYTSGSMVRFLHIFPNFNSNFDS